MKRHEEEEEVLIARAASVICSAACGLYSECKSREAADALMDAGLLIASTPKNAAPELIEALQFYANPEVYRFHPHGLAFDERDLSYVAKAAISKAEGRS